MQLFRQALDNCDLKDIPLQNRKFTWSNERRHPTLVRLDRFFCNPEWEEFFDNYGLHSLSSSVSDHYPLLLSNNARPRRPCSFKFENFGQFYRVSSRWWSTLGRSRPNIMNLSIGCIINSRAQPGRSGDGAPSLFLTLGYSCIWPWKFSLG
jgi:hypothetical protein